MKVCQKVVNHTLTLGKSQVNECKKVINQSAHKNQASMNFHKLWRSVRSTSLFTEVGYVSTGMGNRFSALYLSLMDLRLTLVDQNPFRTCFLICIIYLALVILQNLFFDWVEIAIYNIRDVIFSTQCSAVINSVGGTVSKQSDSSWK